jgi:hypothetical protein
MYRSDRQITEATLPSSFFWSVMVNGVADPDAPHNAAIIALLDEAMEAELVGLTSEQRGKILRRSRRIYQEAVTEFERQQIEAGKFGLVVFYLFQMLRDQGLFRLAEGGPLDRALEEILPAVAEWTAVAAVDASAQKQARRLLKLLQGEGYFREAVPA